MTSKTVRINLYLSMASFAGTSVEQALEGDDIPEGWDDMTDDEKTAAMEPVMDEFIANNVNAGWGEDTDA